MQAIRTKFFGPTNTRGERIQASAEAATIYVSWDYCLGVEGNHKAACEALRAKLGWNSAAGSTYTPMVAGEFGGAHYWVFSGELSTSTSAE